MAAYEVSNRRQDNLSIRSGPAVIFNRIASMAPGNTAKADFIFTYQSELTTDGQTRAATNDQWVHITELNGAPVDGWTAIRHLGRSYASVSPASGAELLVTFGVELEGYNPITLTGTLTPR